MTASAEQYIKTICLLELSFKKVRVIDIANTLSVAKASVCNAFRKLAAKGYVKHERYGDVELTDKGRQIGHALIENCQWRALCQTMGN